MLTPEMTERYARHIVLREIGGAGQQRLCAARVALVGLGGLGSPVALYLAAAGVGELVLIDDDVVSLSNLQRQIALQDAARGELKTGTISRTIRMLNPEVSTRLHPVRLESGNVVSLLAGVDLVCDCSDNFATRLLVNDACFFLGIPLVFAAASGFDGQVSTFAAWRGAGHPCYRCLFPGPPAEEAGGCTSDGILGSVAGVTGCFQATEAIKELAGAGTGLSGRLLLYDALTPAVRIVRLVREPACPLCGDSPVIRGLPGLPVAGAALPPAS